MLPLLRNRLVVFIGPDRFSVLKLRRGLKPEVVRQHDETISPSGKQPVWQASLGKLGVLLTDPEWQAPTMEVVLSNQFVRYAVVSFDGQLKKYAEREAYAKHILAHTYGPAIGQWPLRVQKAKSGSPALVGAVEQAVISGLGELCRTHKIKLLSISPYLIHVFHRVQGMLAGETAWLVVAEPGYTLLSLVDKGNFKAINGIAHSAPHELPALLDRENLVSGLSEPCRKVYWHGPSDGEVPDFRDAGYEFSRLDVATAGVALEQPTYGRAQGGRFGGVWLDYARPGNQARQAAGWMLFAAGLALLLEMSISYGKLHSEKRAIAKELQAAGVHLDLSNVPVGRHYTEKDVAAARDIMTRLSAPWENLFATIESIKNKKVAILALEPDIQTGQVTIQGEARNYAALLTFIAQLRVKKAFADVFLLRHDEKENDPQHPVAFTVSMRWLRS